MRSENWNPMRLYSSRRLPSGLAMWPWKTQATLCGIKAIGDEANGRLTESFNPQQLWGQYQPIYSSTLRRFRNGTGGWRRFMRWVSICLGATICVSAFAQSNLGQQEIHLGTGWNLISIQIAPSGFLPEEVVPGLENPNTLLSIWGYDASSRQWQSYQPRKPNYPNDLTRLIPGRGYWIEVASSTTLRLSGAAWDGGVGLIPGWNLVGFGGGFGGAAEDQTLGAIFRDRLDRVPQVWTYGGGTLRRFVGYDAVARPPIAELSGIESGRGYWVFSLAAMEIRPMPALLLTPDSDQDPLQEPPEDFRAAVEAGPEDLAAGFDLNGNGWLDSPYTQDTIQFPVGVNSDSISVLNAGTGAFAWSVESNVPWLQVEPASGVTATEVDTIRLTALRAGLLPGSYSNHFTVHLGDTSQEIHVRLEVPTAQGDYRGSAEVQRVNAKDIPLGKVDLHFSLYDDSPNDYRSFRAVISREKALLFPQDVTLKGVFYAGNDFTLTTTFEMPTGDRNSPPYDNFRDGTDKFGDRSLGDVDVNRNGVLDNFNPFPFPVRRQITLIGTRKDDGLLEGSYIESIQNALPNGQPIYLEGTFSLVRDSFTPSLRTAFNGRSTITPVSIGGSGVLGYTNTIQVADAVQIQAVTVKATTDYPSPAQLRFSLIGPTGLQATLAPDPSSPGVFHAQGFDGTLGNGDWSLVVTWNSESGERGFFLGWELNLEGVVLRSAQGQVVIDGATGASKARATLIGGNVPQTQEVTSGGRFSFEDLTEDAYQINITKPGYQTLTTNFFLAGSSNIELGTFTLQPLANTDPVVLVEPPFGAAPLVVTFTPLIPLDRVSELGATPSARWDFGDGTGPLVEADDPFASVQHNFSRGGAFTVVLTLTGQTTQTYTASVLAHALEPNPVTPALAASQHFIHSIGFIGSLASASPLPATPVDVRVIGPEPPDAVFTFPALRAVVYGESQRDVASFDINRDFGEPEETGGPDAFRPQSEDSDFFYQPNDLVPGPGLPPQRVPDSVRARQADADTRLTEYAQPVVNGVPVPDRYRMVVTLGGYIFPPEEPPGRPWKDNTPRVAALKLQAGRIEP